MKNASFVFVIALTVLASGCTTTATLKSATTPEGEAVFLSWRPSFYKTGGNRYLRPESVNGSKVKDVLIGSFVDPGSTTIKYSCSLGWVRDPTMAMGGRYTISETHEAAIETKAGYMYFLDVEPRNVKSDKRAVPFGGISTIVRGEDGKLYSKFEAVYEERTTTTPEGCGLRYVECEGYLYKDEFSNRFYCTKEKAGIISRLFGGNVRPAF